jgi:AraC-like DNA-binding protein
MGRNNSARRSLSLPDLLGALQEPADWPCDRAHSPRSVALGICRPLYRPRRRTVMHYATRWRMQTASRWLKEEDVTIAEAASRLGYESEAAFSRAFKRFAGVSPGAARSRTSAPRQRVERTGRLAASISAG